MEKKGRRDLNLSEFTFSGPAPPTNEKKTIRAAALRVPVHVPDYVGGEEKRKKACNYARNISPFFHLPLMEKEKCKWREKKKRGKGEKKSPAIVALRYSQLSLRNP